MKEFSLKFEGEEFNFDNEKVHLAKITIGNFSEKMNIPLSYWNKEQYEEQWEKAFFNLLNKHTKTALITRIYDPKNSNFLEWWVLYLKKDIVYIQNEILFFNELEIDFNEKNFFSIIPERESLTEEGEQISEWSINFNAIENYCKKRNSLSLNNYFNYYYIEK